MSMEGLKETDILIKKAYEAMEYAYSPYSEFKVGAAVVALNNSGEEKVFVGCNIENGSYGATICAERTAMCKAVSEGYVKLKRVAIVSSSGDFTYPCGVCRQFLSEFSNEATEVILHNKDDEAVKTYLLAELLPEAFVFIK